MILTNNRLRRKRYKQLWYQKKRAKAVGDKGRYNVIEAEMDELRKIKREPEARKRQLARRAIRNKKVYERRTKLGVFRRISNRYRQNHLEYCRARNRWRNHHLSPKERKRRLAFHRKWNRNHLALVRKRARDYARTHRKRARENARRYYYRHKNDRHKN